MLYGPAPMPLRVSFPCPFFGQKACGGDVFGFGKACAFGTRLSAHGVSWGTAPKGRPGRSPATTRQTRHESFRPTAATPPAATRSSCPDTCPPRPTPGDIRHLAFHLLRPLFHPQRALTVASTLPATNATQKPNKAAFGYGNVFNSQCRIVVRFKNKCSIRRRCRYNGTIRLDRTFAGKFVSTWISVSPSRVGTFSTKVTRRTTSTWPAPSSSHNRCS